MHISDSLSLKNTARQRLEGNSAASRILLIYVGISFGCSLLSLLVSYFLDNQVNQFGGLGNLGIRTMLSSIGLALPLILSIGLMGLDLGYLGAMLRISRGQYTSPNAFRLGYDRFWPFIRCQIIRMGIYFFYVLGAAYAASLVFVLTPFSQNAMALLGSGIPDPAAMDPELAVQLLGAMAPMFLLYFVLLAVFLIPVFYAYRMAPYVILDKPGTGGFAALRESTRMMRGNRKALFRLDLQFWWYYLLMLLSTALCYGDSLLPMFGIALPFSPEVCYFLFYFLYLATQFGIFWLFRNRVEVTYALAYDSVRPKEAENGVVLGNIFQM